MRRNPAELEDFEGVIDIYCRGRAAKVYIKTGSPVAGGGISGKIGGKAVQGSWSRVSRVATKILPSVGLWTLNITLSLCAAAEHYTVIHTGCMQAPDSLKWLFLKC